jgi:hypothetical protein
MSPRTVKRRRRSKGQLTAAGTSVSPATLLAQFTELVSENQALARENRELHVVIARVTKAVDVMSSAPRAARRSLQQTAGRGSAAAPSNGRRRQRRRITDPASLERRRAALAKARQVLAEKRAAEKATP